jgi:hypothetical protein
MDNLNYYDRSHVYTVLIITVTISIFMLSQSEPLSSVYSIMFTEFKQYQFINLSSVKAYGLSLDNGQFHCTDSSVVHSSSECPLTEQCPGVKEGINLVQCTLKSSQTENEQNTI